MGNDVRKGQHYEAVEPIPVRFLAHWRAPFTSGGVGTLPAGERFIISSDVSWGTSAVKCDAERPKEIERLLVPEEDRNGAKYAGFSLFIDCDTIRTKCRRIDAV